MSRKALGSSKRKSKTARGKRTLSKVIVPKSGFDQMPATEFSPTFHSPQNKLIPISLRLR